MIKFTLKTIPPNMSGIPNGTIFYRISSFTRDQLAEIYGEEENTTAAEYIMIMPDNRDTAIGQMLQKFTKQNTL